MREFLLSLWQRPHDECSLIPSYIQALTPTSIQNVIIEYKHKDASRLNLIYSCFSLLNHCWFMLLPQRLTTWLHKTVNYIFINAAWPNVFTWHSLLDCEISARLHLSLQDKNVSIELQLDKNTKTVRKPVFYSIIELHVQQVHISCSRVSDSERCKIRMHVFKGKRENHVKTKKCWGTKCGSMKRLWCEHLTKIKSLFLWTPESSWTETSTETFPTSFLMNLNGQEHILWWRMGNN